MAAAIHDLLTPDQFRAQYAELAQGIRDKVTADERRAAWLEQKRGKFGASSAWKFWTAGLKEAHSATVEKYLNQKAAECDGLLSSEIGGSAIRHGNDQETPGAIDFMERTGLVMTNYGDDQKWIEWKGNNQVGCTPDGLIRCSFMHPKYQVVTPKALLVFEQKNNVSIDAYEELASMESGEDLIKVNPKYGIQVQHQMMVTGAVAAVFMARYVNTTSGVSDLSWFIVLRNDAFIERHAERLQRAVRERDAYRTQRASRKLVDLNQFITQ